MGAIKSNVKPQNITKTYENCVKGCDLVNWIIKEQSYTVPKAIEFYKNLLEKGILKSVDGGTSFQNSETALYYFQEFKYCSQLSLPLD